jgi:hypothetical protein
LKEAVVKVFWTRAYMKTMLKISGVPDALIMAQDWEQYKFLIVSPIVDSLNGSVEGLGPLRRMLQETLRYKDCKHLLRFNDGKKLRREAEGAVSHLRSLVDANDAAKATEEEERQRRRARMEQAQKGRIFQEKLGQLRDLYMQLLSKEDENERGLDLEKLLNASFSLFELAPHSPFRRVGEQIDGAFVLDRDSFLLEAKWQKKQSNLADLRDLDGAVSSSLDNTLGLFVSITGFTPEALSGYVAGNRPRLICMDGGDLMMVLDGRIDLPELLFRKKEVASQRRKILVSASDILMGRS